MSVEYRLPLLICLLLLVVIASFAVVAYREVRRSALASATDRLSRGSEQLASISEGSARLALGRLADAAADSAVRAAAERPSPRTSAAAQRALRAVPFTASPPVSEIWSASGERLVTTQDAPARPQIAAFLRAGGVADSAGYGPVWREGDSVYAASVAPIRAEGRRVGHLVRFNRLGVPAQTRAQLEALISRDAVLHFAHLPSRTITTAEGRPVSLPIGLDATQRVSRFERDDGEQFFAATVPVRGTPWAIVTVVSRERALARTRVVFARLSAAALVLLALGAFGAWLLSRTITAPLRRVTQAAEAIAAGDYSTRVDIARQDEVGRLAHTFEVMSRRVEESVHFLRSALQAAESASRAKSQFLATMSHEIRTPLNAIVGYVDMLQFGLAGPLSEEQRAHLDRVRANANHLASLIGDLLDLSAIEAERVPVHRRAVSAHATVEAALELVRPLASERGLALSVGCAAETGTSYLGDELRVRQIVVNLLANAIKFTPAGGRVSVDCGGASEAEPSALLDGSGPWVFVAVEDSGVGIDEEQIASIWEPFVQTDMSLTRAHGGIGLGLTISRRLARLMGGDLTVRSERHQGSTFTLWLPAAPPALEVSQPPRLASPSPGGD
jgi:signal transduction histidine kinase